MSPARPHIFVLNTSSKEGYTSRPAGGGGDKETAPKRKREDHAEKLLKELQVAWDEAKKRKEKRAAIGLGTATGVCLQFRSDPEFELALESLDLKSQGVELLSVHEEANCQVAAVYIPDDKIAYFLNKFQDYAAENDRWGKPKNRTLVDSISELKLATLRSLWTDERSLFPSENNEVIWWEVWLRDPSTEDAPSDQVLQRFREFSKRLELTIKPNVIRFLDRTVVLVRASRNQLIASIDILAEVAELRLAKENPVFFMGLQNAEQAEWAADLVERLEAAADDAPAVCVLDTGVNRQHPLLADSLAPEDCHTWQPNWGTADQTGHGTEMAGLALFGDLVRVLEHNDPVELTHLLESVKILRNAGDNVDPEMYGAITSSSVAEVEVQAPERDRVFSMAVTGPDNRDRGKPSSWSAELDALAYGESPLGGRKRLFIVSAGNAQQPVGADYFEEAMTEGIYDPGQSWNTITVGAYTTKHSIEEDIFDDWSPLAPPGDLTPGTSTSCLWTKTAWPIKPDFVTEGGNMVVSPDGDTDHAASLESLTTFFQPFVRHFTTSGQTSAAASEAARQAAIIMSRYPDAWPETVRGLMVHSCKWTKQMMRRMGDSRESLLRCYGYGVPNLRRALESAGNSLTLVAQDYLVPFEGEEMKEMAVHELPWPTEVLEELGETPVKLRITLSYFIEPNPARRGWTTRHRYASHGLRFDIKTPTESLLEFRKRINKQALAKDEKPTSKSDADEWEVGPILRHKGSVHSDIWRGTAAALAERDHIAVYPVGGWWRERHQLGRGKNGARYSLIVSIDTPRTDVELYLPVANLVGIEV